MKDEATWRLLQKAINKIGIKKVYEQLDKIHYACENMAAEYWADPDTYDKAKKMQPMLTRQSETLLRLRLMMNEKANL